MADCLKSPHRSICDPIDSECPDTFTTMYTHNETGNGIAKCVPKSFKVTTNDQKERESLDPLRCALGYKLEINDSENIYRRGGDDPIGSCIKI